MGRSKGGFRHSQLVQGINHMQDSSFSKLVKQYQLGVRKNWESHLGPPSWEPAENGVMVSD